MNLGKGCKACLFVCQFWLIVCLLLQYEKQPVSLMGRDEPGKMWTSLLLCLGSLRFKCDENI